MRRDRTIAPGNVRKSAVVNPFLRPRVLALGILTVISVASCTRAEPAESDGGPPAGDAGPLARDADPQQRDGDAGAPPSPVLVVLEVGVDPPPNEHLTAYALDSDPPALLFETSDIGGTALVQPMHVLSAPRLGDFFLVAEGLSGWVSRWSISGERLSSAPWLGPTAVGATADRMYFAHDARIYGASYDNLSYPDLYPNLQGAEVAVDEERGILWTAGDGIFRGDVGVLGSGELVSNPTVHVLSMDVAPDGTLWAIPQAAEPGGDRRALHYGVDGTPLPTVMLPSAARGVRVHPDTGDVWITAAGVLRIDSGGTLHEVFPQDGTLWFGLVADPGSSGIRVSAMDGPTVLIGLDGHVQHGIEPRLAGEAYRHLTAVVPAG